MPHQAKAVESAEDTSAKKRKKNPKPKGPNGVKLYYLEWAWKFLRRNPEYKLLYSLSKEGSAGSENTMEALATHPILRDLPIYRFDVIRPEPKYDDTLGSWLDRSFNAQEGVEFNPTDISDPRRFGLTTWIDPAIPMPDDIANLIDLSQFALDEVWAINFQSKEQYEKYKRLGPHPRDFECQLGLAATSPTQVAIRFDLRLPLEFQLAQAERQLINAEKTYKEFFDEDWHQIPEWEIKVNHMDSWDTMLGLLDKEDGAKSSIESPRVSWRPVGLSHCTVAV